MDIVDSILSAASLDDARAALAAGLNSDDDVKARYQWAHKAVFETTVGYIAAYLAANPPQVWLRYNQIAEHVKVAGNQLEQCIERQDQLFELEASCISAVIDSLNADRVFEIDRALETTSALADSRAAQQPDTGVAERVRAKYEIRRKAFDYRATFYQAKGGALNFNERIAFLRRLQAESMRTIHERLFALRVGLGIAGIAKLKAPPAWNADNPGLLMDLVLWLRGAMQAMEKQTYLEYPIVISFSSLQQAAAFENAAGVAYTNDGLKAALRTGGWDDIYFNLTPALIQSRTSIGDIRSARLISLSMGVVSGANYTGIIDVIDDKDKRDREIALATQIKTWRALFRVGARVTPPNQKVKFDDDGLDINGPQRDIYLDEQLPVSEVSDPDGLCALPSDRVANLNPFGRWRMAVLDRMSRAIGDIKLSETWWNGAHSWANVDGLIVTVNLALRRD